MMPGAQLAGWPCAGWLSEGPPRFGFMPPLPRITGRELARALGKLGWVVVAQKGSHAQLKHPSRGGRVTVPLHAGETIGPGLLRSILSQAGVTVEELRAVL
ncbi:MAG: type II toxin-antitoxin system HicA family toxin [Streptosporangiaceae bacterium]